MLQRNPENRSDIKEITNNLYEFKDQKSFEDEFDLNEKNLLGEGA